MFRLSAHTRLFALLCCLVLATVTWFHFSRTAVHAATGFTPQTRLGFPAGDDWEPAIAADHYGHVYVLYKHYDVAGQTSCTSCALHVLLQISNDRGQTWSAPGPIDPEPVVGGQYDSQIVVDPIDGKTVWASFLQNSKSSIAVMKSTDFGQTWSGPTIVENLQRATDKDELAVRGSTIAIAYNAVQKIYASISHDGGQTWATHLINSGSTQQGWSLGGGAGIDSQGNIYFTWAGYSQNGQAKGPVNLFVTESRDGGQAWRLTTIGVSGAPYPCTNCGFAFLGAQMTMAIGRDDSLYLLYNATVDQTDYAPERIYFVKSTDHGASYSTHQDVSLAPQGIEHCFPAITQGTQSGDVRIAWTDRRTGSWNLFYRSSSNGGASWGGETQVSSYVPGYSYITPTGFGLPYGDYFQMAVDDRGSTQLAWGESGSYAGPGNMWTAHN
ncbi:MAG TPA: sialidase family protein [Ktedonobacteraceae bacterium]